MRCYFEQLKSIDSSVSVTDWCFERCKTAGWRGPNTLKSDLTRSQPATYNVWINRMAVHKLNSFSCWNNIAAEWLESKKTNNSFSLISFISIVDSELSVISCLQWWSSDVDVWQLKIFKEIIMLKNIFVAVFKSLWENGNDYEFCANMRKKLKYLIKVQMSFFHTVNFNNN